MDAAACSPAGPAWWCQAIRHRRTLRWCRFLRPRGREVDPIIRTTGLDRNPCVFLSRKRLCFWDSTKEGVYAKEKAIV